MSRRDNFGNSLRFIKRMNNAVLLCVRASKSCVFHGIISIKQTLVIVQMMQSIIYSTLFICLRPQTKTLFIYVLKQLNVRNNL